MFSSISPFQFTNFLPQRFKGSLKNKNTVSQICKFLSAEHIEMKRMLILTMMKGFFQSDGSWSKFLWINCECDFNSHHLHETRNLWMPIFPLLWFWVKTCQFHGGITCNCRKYVNWAWTKIHDSCGTEVNCDTAKCL